MNSFNISVCLCVLVAACGVQLARSEVFSALVEMEGLIETESYLISYLEVYIKAQQQKVDSLKKKLLEYQVEHSEAALDTGKYLANPINAYLLTKRLTNDWIQVEALLQSEPGKEELAKIVDARSVLKFPTSEDLTGAATALMRLQNTYNLETSSLAKGILNGIQYSSELTTGDCFELGRQSYNNEDYYHTVEWMTEALNRFMIEEGFSNNHNQSEPEEFTKAEILEYLAFSTFKEGDVESALEMTNELLELQPNHHRAKGNKNWYETVLRDANENTKRGDDGSADITLSNVKMEIHKNPSIRHTENSVYEMLCRGDLKQTPAQQRELVCKYVTNNVPFLKIAPLKLEEANKSPYIVIYHEVMYDKEIEVVKNLAKPRFKRATVQNSVTGKLETANYRISKSSWLKTEEHKYIEDIVQRTEDMTGLDMLAAEELQVVNYGIGGHYEPHYDFSRREEENAFKELGTGNRIATVLFYMSDVEQGGATVFPQLSLSLLPKKGTAAFWYNLYASGEGDLRTRHAACPVLTGSKWVSNKWIHERMQEFRRPCDLIPDHPLEYDE
ncbi:P4HA2 family protein [Megaselia abdita]